MKVAVIRFPGSNCDQDAFHSLRDDLGLDADYVWSECRSLAGFDAVFLPGGFSFGDYLRCGAMAARAPIMDEVRRMANDGALVLGVCNGFQILCEAGLLPGALMRNQDQRFVCRWIHLRAEQLASPWTRGVTRIFRIPVAHGAGRYVVDDEMLAQMRAYGQVAFRYVDEHGECTPSANFNGSVDGIAGVLNRQGNVLGMMPHPERATRSLLGSEDGRLVLQAFRSVVESV